MKALAIVGVILIILGILGLVFQAIPGTTQRDTVQIGPVQTTVETKKSYVIPPIVSGLVLTCGAVLVVLAWKKKS